MHTTPPRPKPFRLTQLLSHWVMGFLMTVLLALAGMAANAAPPPAGTSISNQASATYTDASAVSRTVNSNTVSTTVLPVASLTLTSNGSQNATPGSVVYYPHTLTNTGNGADTFNLITANAGGFAMTSVQIFADNGSGLPTGPAITSTGAIPSNGIFRFVVAGTLPAGAAAPQTNTITVTATSVLDSTKTAFNTDVTTVSANAVVTLTKAVSANSGPAPSGPYTYTLTYTNIGNSVATNVAVSDALPAGLDYVASSARWSVTGATALSDSGASSGTAPNTLSSSYTSGTRTFLATLAQVNPGQSGTLSFQVTIASTIPPGVLSNTATTSYTTGGATVTGSSNTVPFTVTASNSVTLTGATIASAVPGETVSFTNVVKNTGTATDSFNITIAANSFPAGTGAQLYKSDGVTPLVDTNGDGIIDTGPLAPGASYSVILKGTLPPNASGGPFAVTKTATSVSDPTKIASANDTITLVKGAKVDLTNNLPAAAGVPGFGPGPEGAAQVTIAANPGTPAVFTLVANNTGTSADSYDLLASSSPTFPGTLPAGWTVTFKADASGGAAKCSITGATITNTGPVPVAGNTTVCAIVAVPPGYTVGTQDVYFRARSPVSGLSDALHNAVSVNAVRSITVTPNGTGQTYPSGSVVYSHTVTNTGNVTEGNGVLSTLTFATANNQTGFTSVLYYDANGNGTLDASDPVISGGLNAVLSTGLAPGASITMFDKVIATAGAAAGVVNVTTITATTTNGSYSTAVPVPAVATDTTTIVVGNLTLTKGQALDAGCAGSTTSTSYSTSALLSAKPGQCVLYQLTVSNLGAADATSVVVSDSTPTYTLLSTAAATSVGTVTGPAVGAAGTVSATIATLVPGQTALITFGVKINQ